MSNTNTDSDDPVDGKPDWATDGEVVSDEESDDTEDATNPGLIQSIWLFVLGLLRGVWDWFAAGKQGAANALARHAGDSDDSSTLTEESEEERRERLEERAESIADTLENTVGVLVRQFFDLFRVLTFTLSSIVMRAIPKSGALADSIIETGVNLKKNATGADALVFPAYGDKKVVPQAANWHSKETKYVTSNGEEYSAKGSGHSPYRLFGVDVVFTLRESAEVFDPVQAACAAQREIGDWAAWVRQSDNKRQVVLGGNPPDGTDGWVLDWNKVWDQYYQKITQEDLERQNKIGRLAELDDEAKTRVVLMVLGAFIGGIVACLVVLWAASNLIADASGTISLFASGWLL